MLPPSAWSLAGRPYELARTAPRHPLPDAPIHGPTTDQEVTMTIRRARPDDAHRLADLAQLDSARPLRGDEILVAEADGVPVAALEVFTGRSVADPMVPSAGAVDLLRVRAEQLRAADRPVRARRRRPFAALAGHLR